MDKPVDEKEELILKVYRINYRMEYFVEATSEDAEYVQFVSIKELPDDK
jgi:hypothetical protein